MGEFGDGFGSCFFRSLCDCTGVILYDKIERFLKENLKKENRLKDKE